MTFHKNNRGGMLIDLLIVVGIIALIAGISIPYLRKYQPNLKLHGAARNLAGDLRLAQQLAVTQQKVHVVYFNQANKQYLIQRLDTNATTTVKTVNLDPELSYQEITGFTDNYVHYNFYGGVSQAGQIILKNTNNITSTINIKASGYVELP